MITLDDLCIEAEKEGIEIDYFTMNHVQSLSTPDNWIAVNKNALSSSREELVCLAHEIGHCQTGSFYNIHSPFDIRQKHENHADRWAIKKIIPKDDLDKAVKKGITALWELAEYFNVTEIFVKKAIEYYSIAG